jgi:hypothetical protein
MEILVFKTSIQHQDDVQRVGDIFSRVKDILTWHVDTEDEDNVLRVEAVADISSQVKYLVGGAGYFCQELL